MVDYSGIPNEGDKILNPKGDFTRPDLQKIREHRDWFYKKPKAKRKKSRYNGKSPMPA